MISVDAAEKRRGEEPFLETHYGQFAVSSKHVHPTLHGPGTFRLEGDHMVVNMNGNHLLGFSALRFGAYYFFLGTQSVAHAAGAGRLEGWAKQRYDGLKGAAQTELDRLLALG